MVFFNNKLMVLKIRTASAWPRHVIDIDTPNSKNIIICYSDSEGV